ASVSCVDERIGNKQGAVWVWELATGKEVKRFPSAKYYCQAAWLPDSKALVVSGFGQSHIPHLYDITTGKERCLIGEKERVSLAAMSHDLVAVSPDGKCLVSRNALGALHILETVTGKVRATVPAHHVGSAALTPEVNNRLTQSNPFPVIRLWELATGKEGRPFTGHEAGIICLALSPDGRTLASGSYDQTIRLWEVATGKERRCFRGHQGTV